MKLKQFKDSENIQLYKATGCSECGDIGYKGRQAIVEFLPMSEKIRKQIMTHEESGIIQQQGIKEGMLTLYDDGILKALDGITTLEEVLRVTTES